MDRITGALIGIALVLYLQCLCRWRSLAVQPGLFTVNFHSPLFPRWHVGAGRFGVNTSIVRNVANQ